MRVVRVDRSPAETNLRSDGRAIHDALESKGIIRAERIIVALAFIYIVGVFVVLLPGSTTQRQKPTASRAKRAKTEQPVHEPKRNDELIRVYGYLGEKGNTFK